MARSDRIETHDVAVVIDVLRATSVMAMALHNGATAVLTTGEVAAARALAESRSTRPLLCGERGCRPIDGFDLGNSPAEYGSQRVRGKTLVLTTTNGTRAVEFAERAQTMIAASFLNLEATLQYLADADSVHLVCAGTNGEITAEDVMLAGAIVEACETRYETRLRDDTSLIARQLWRSWFGDKPSDLTARVAEKLRESQGGRNLLQLGYEADLQRCAQVNSVQVVPKRVATAPVEFRA